MTETGEQPKGDVPRTSARARLVPTKLRPPRQHPGLISRPRLLKRFTQYLPRLILVSAPAGSGKTELVAEWYRSLERPAGWLSLDSEDREPQRFFAHLAAAVEGIGGHAAAEILARATSESLPPLDGSLEAAWGEMDEHAVLALDDLHELEDGAVTDWLGRFLERVQGGPRTVVLTRVDPSFPLGRLRVSGELLEIRQDDLRFSEEETSRFFALVRPDGLSPKLISLLESRTEGWAAGLKLAGIALAHAADPEEVVSSFTGTHRFVADYLMEEAMESLTPPLRRFLMETSVLPEFTPGSCEGVTGCADARALLAEVEERGLFLVTLDRSSELYRFHQLFSELLTFRLKREDPERLEDLRLRASRWFRKKGDVYEALRQASLSRDPGVLTALLDEHGFDMLARGEFASFGRWLEFIPQPLHQPYPLFLMTLAWYRLLTERAPDLDSPIRAARAALAQAPPGYPEEREERVKRHLVVIRAFELRLADRLEEAIQASSEALASLPEEETWFRGILAFSLAATHLRTGNMLEAGPRLEEAFEINLAGGPPYLILASMAHLGAVLVQTEGTESALSRLDAAEEFARKEGLAGLPAMGVIHCVQSQVRFLRDELQAAREAAEAALPLCDRGREPDVEGNALVQLARAHSGLGDMEEAERLLTRAEGLSHLHSVKPYSSSFRAERARLALLKGDREGALALLGTAAEGSGVWSTPKEAETLILLRARMRKNDRAGIEPVARQVLERAEAGARGVAWSFARTALAMVSDDPDHRWTMLDEALQMAGPRGYVRPFLEGGEPVRSLLQAGIHHLASAEGKAAAHTLLERFEAMGPGPSTPADPPDLIQPLTDREMEVLGHLAEGLSNKGIAKSMFVSVDTVKTHLKNLYGKLGVSSRKQAVVQGRELGLLPGPGRSAET